MALIPRYEAKWILLYCFIEMNVTLNYIKYGSTLKLANHDGKNKKINQDCLYLLNTIMSSNQSLVNAYELLSCISIISFSFLK